MLSRVRRSMTTRYVLHTNVLYPTDELPAGNGHRYRVYLLFDPDGMVHMAAITEPGEGRAPVDKLSERGWRKGKEDGHGRYQVDGRRIAFWTADPSGVVDWAGTIDADSLLLESRTKDRRVVLPVRVHGRCSDPGIQDGRVGPAPAVRGRSGTLGQASVRARCS
jgi:hypothetical protein